MEGFNFSISHYTIPVVFMFQTFTDTLIGNHIVVDQTYIRDQLVDGLSMTSWSKGKLLINVSNQDVSLHKPTNSNVLNPVHQVSAA